MYVHCIKFIINFILNFNVHHKDWLTYSGGTDRPGEFCYNFLSQLTLIRWLIFLLRSLTVTLTILLFWIYLFLSALVFVLQWLSLHRLSVGDAGFHRIAYEYCRVDWDGVCDNLREVPWADIFKLSATSEFCEWVQVIIDLYIPHIPQVIIDFYISSNLTYLHIC